MYAGEHAAELVVLSEDPDEPVFPVAVNLRVDGAPNLQVVSRLVSGESRARYVVSGARTSHRFTVDRPRGIHTSELGVLEQSCTIGEHLTEESRERLPMCLTSEVADVDSHRPVHQIEPRHSSDLEWLVAIQSHTSCGLTRWRFSGGAIAPPAATAG